MWIECNPQNLGKCRYLTDSAKISGMTEVKAAYETEAGPTQESESGSTDLIREPATGRFIKGVSGNPKGRPKKGSRVSDFVESFGIRKNAEIAASLYKGAKSGSIRHIEAVLAYQSGLPVKRVQVTSRLTTARDSGDSGRLTRYLLPARRCYRSHRERAA